MSGRTTTVLDIRELLRHLRDGRSNREIHRSLGLGRETIRKYRQWAEHEGLLSGVLPALAELQTRLAASQPPAPPQTISTVEPYRAVVQDLLDKGLETEAICQRLKEQHGFTGHYQAVWRFVRKLEPQRPDVTVRVELAPGVEVQVDFGYAGMMFDLASQKVRKAWAFVGTLSFSRHQYVEFVFDQTVPTWLACHRRLFEFFGGVLERVRIDNLKAAIVRVCLEEPEAQRAYRECAEHYGFLITPCRPHTPQHKGKVESGVHYVKRNFLAGRDYTLPQHNFQHANQEVLGWVMGTAGQRRHGTTKQIPLEQFEQVERAALRPLPPTPFELVTWQQVKLHRDCYIVFDNAYYSAPHRYVGETLWVRATAKVVEIHREFERLVIHTRAARPGERQTLLTHLPPEKVAGLTLTPSACLDRAHAIGSATGEVVLQLLNERPVDRLRAVHRLLARAEKDNLARLPTGGLRLERACARALAFGEVSVRTIENMLKTGIADQTAGEAPEPAPDWPQPRYAREAGDLVPAHLKG
jgi:transposase